MCWAKAHPGWPRRLAEADLAARGLPCASRSHGRRITRSTHCVRCAQTGCGKSVYEAREYARGHEPCDARRFRRRAAASPSAPLQATMFLRRQRNTGASRCGGRCPGWAICGAARARAAAPSLPAQAWTARAPVASRNGLGAFWSARVLARFVNTSAASCLSATNAVSAASYAARPKREHRSAVGAQRRPLHHEPTLGTACRVAPRRLDSKGMS